MASDHWHGATPHATAAPPTLSLLRLSAVQRLAGAAAVLACLWLMVLLTI
jgi:uncharacterized membrane protein